MQLSVVRVPHRFRLRRVALLLWALISLPAGVGAQARPLSFAEVTDLLTNGVSQSQIVVLVGKSCRAFQVTDAIVRRLRALGGSEALVAGLRAACVARGANVAPTPTPSPPRPQPPRPQPVRRLDPAPPRVVPRPQPTPPPAPSTTHAAIVGTISPSESRSGTLGPGDQRVTSTLGPVRHQDWRLTVSSAQSAVVTLVGSGSAELIDPELAIYDSNGAEIARNDDTNGLDSRIETALAPGEYVICARSHTTEGLGSYTLTVSPPASPPSASHRAIVGSILADSPRTGTLGTIDESVTTPSGAVRHQDWQFSVGASQPVTITLVGNGFDPVLAVYDGNGVEVAVNDDADGVNSRIQTTLAPGEYIICARAFSTSGLGSYTLTVSTLGSSGGAGGASHRAVVGTIFANSSSSGTLSTTDPTVTAPMGEVRHDDWRFSVSGTQSVTISLDGIGFDPELGVYDSNGSQVATDDDGGDGVNSRIETTLPPGEYIICARGHYSHGVGSYTLRVSSR